MKIIRMPFFLILVLSAVLYTVSSIFATPSVRADNADSQSKPTTNNVSPSNAPTNNAPTRNASTGNVSTSSAAKVTGKTIELPHLPPDFPPGNGRELFISRCGVCHSLRYITMQPNFPEKTWAKEVDKMIKTYGAHIDKKEAKEIIEYLNSIKGKAPSAEKH
jgi:mono/diheme cytochrome c family protein